MKNINNFVLKSIEELKNIEAKELIIFVYENYLSQGKFDIPTLELKKSCPLTRRSFYKGKKQLEERGILKKKYASINKHEGEKGSDLYSFYPKERIN